MLRKSCSLSIDNHTHNQNIFSLVEKVEIIISLFNHIARLNKKWNWKFLTSILVFPNMVLTISAFTLTSRTETNKKTPQQLPQIIVFTGFVSVKVPSHVPLIDEKNTYFVPTSISRLLQLSMHLSIINNIKLSVKCNATSTIIGYETLNKFWLFW